MDFANLNLTDNEHLYWGHEFATGRHPESFSFRRQSEDRFYFELGQLRRPPLPFAAELRLALKRLVDTHGTKLSLFYSGGSDSEVILRELVTLGVTPEVHVIKFEDALNAHETVHADELCKSLGVVPYVWTHDIREAVDDGFYYRLGTKWHCTQIAYLTVLHYASKLANTVLMGGEVYLQKHQSPSIGVHTPSSWNYVYREDEDGVTYRYSNETGHKIINEVFTYTPELLYSYLTHPLVSKVAKDEVPGKITLLSVKRHVYEQELGYHLLATTKFHGFERLNWTNIACRRQIEYDLPNMKTVLWEYVSLLEHLRGEQECLPAEN